jgi:NAD(P)-dependent dehydrogenase (short-subunit alcohol dehydrogenase family)
MTTTYPFSVSSNNFEGKRVLVTGGTRGIAETMVCRFTPGTDSVATCPRSCLTEKITTADLQYLSDSDGSARAEVEIQSSAFPDEANTDRIRLN